MHIWELGLHVTFDVVSNSSKVNTWGFLPFFEQKIQGLSRTHFPFFKDSIQCKKCLEFSSTTTWAILSWRSFMLGTQSGLDKVSIEIQGLSSIDCNFQGSQGPWIFILKFQGLFWTFKVHTNPVIPLPCLLQATLSLDLCTVSKLPCCHSSWWACYRSSRISWNVIHKGKTNTL